MQVKTFYVGDRPGGSWSFQVLDQRTGAPYNLAGFTSVKALMVDSDNREVTFPADNVSITDTTSGLVTFLWPTESVFTEPGSYVMQLEFSGVNATRKTTVQEIKVKELGGVSK
jgi:hypothetical protein